MKIAAVDPGGTTGLVRVFDVPISIRSAIILCQTLNDCGQLFWEDVKGTEVEQVQYLYGMLKNFDVVVIEDYVIRLPIRTTKRESLSPVRIGFGLELLLTMSPKFNGRIVYQQSTVLGVITDKRLKQWGLYFGSKDVRSAMKHLIIFLREESKTK